MPNTADQMTQWFQSLYEFMFTIINFLSVDWSELLNSIRPQMQSMVPNFPLIGDLIYWILLGIPISIFNWIFSMFGSNIIGLLSIGLYPLGIILVIRIFKAATIK